MENSVVLNNNIAMPRIGYGVYLTPPSQTRQCVENALSIGYRLIDTAQCYGNERQVGEAVRASNLPRSNVFVTTKLWGCRDHNEAARSIEHSVRELDLGAIDLVLIHEPIGDISRIYQALEDALSAGIVRAIGVSNFHREHYERLLVHANVIPAVNQVETHVFRQQEGLRALMKEHGSVVQAWSPLAASRGGFFQNRELAEVARAHGKTIAQVGLRFLHQQGVAIIPKSTHPERMRENLDILGFELTDDEMERLRTLDQGRSLFSWW